MCFLLCVHIQYILIYSSELTLVETFPGVEKNVLVYSLQLLDFGNIFLILLCGMLSRMNIYIFWKQGVVST